MSIEERIPASHPLRRIRRLADQALRCTDTYLAALAISNGWWLVSFDRDFERFAGLERLLLA